MVKESKDKKGNKVREIRPKVAIAIANLLIKVPPSSHENENLSSGTSSTVNANTVKNPAPAQAAVNNGKSGVMSSRSGSFAHAFDGCCVHSEI